MTDDSAQIVVDSAQYLRNVRPIDPAEVAGYVGHELSAEDVRDILRQHARELGLLEDRSGCFRPPDACVTQPKPERIDRVPPPLSDHIMRLLSDRFGERWYEGATGDELRAAIREFKHRYFAADRVEYDQSTALGYTVYHLPATYASTQYVLGELAAPELLPGHLRVLDVGAGVGGQSLALSTYLGAETLIEYTAIEPSEANAEILSSVLDLTHRNFHWDIRRESVEDASIEGPYDLIVLSNVCSELEAPTQVLPDLASALHATGAMVAIEPADERTSRELRRIETEVVRRRDELDVYSPALRLWSGHQPTDHCWSFVRYPDIDTPRFQRLLDGGRREQASDRDPATGEFVNRDVQVSFSILRLDGKRRIDLTASSPYAPLAESTDAVGDRVDVCVVKLSGSLASGDGNPVYVVGDGSQHDEHFLVLAQDSSLNVAIREANYGDILVIHEGLLLWNADEAAYNIVADDETLVDRVSP